MNAPVSHQKDLISVVLISVVKNILFYNLQSMFFQARGKRKSSGKGAILIPRGGVKFTP